MQPHTLYQIQWLPLGGRQPLSHVSVGQLCWLFLPQVLLSQASLYLGLGRGKGERRGGGGRGGGKVRWEVRRGGVKGRGGGNGGRDGREISSLYFQALLLLFQAFKEFQWYWSFLPASARPWASVHSTPVTPGWDMLYRANTWMKKCAAKVLSRRHTLLGSFAHISVIWLSRGASIPLWSPVLDPRCACDQLSNFNFTIR